MEVQIKLGDQVLDIEGNYTPEDYGVWTYPNGNPGYPGTPAEFEIETIEWVLPTGNIDVIDLLFAIGDDVIFKIEDLILAEIVH